MRPEQTSLVRIVCSVELAEPADTDEFSQFVKVPCCGFSVWLSSDAISGIEAPSKRVVGAEVLQSREDASSLSTLAVALFDNIVTKVGVLATSLEERESSRHRRPRPLFSDEVISWHFLSPTELLCESFEYHTDRRGICHEKGSGIIKD